MATAHIPTYTKSPLSPRGAAPTSASVPGLREGRDAPKESRARSQQSGDAGPDAAQSGQCSHWAEGNPWLILASDSGRSSSSSMSHQGER